MIDCNHGNSQKNHKRQFKVINSIIIQLKQGMQNIMGVMLESHLIEGKQRIDINKALTYGQSITDGCISWRETKKM